MRTDVSKRASSLFVFAHPDDEFFCLPAICGELASGRETICVYLTDGGYGGQLPLVRVKESTTVLTKLGVDKDHIYFVGVQNQIPDGRLHHHLDAAYEGLNRVAYEHRICNIYCPAWEGGHQDHDACHVICIKFAAEHAGLPVMQFSLYNAYHTILPFNVMKILPGNGPVSTLDITWRDAFRYLSTVTAYRSQWKTWIGLFPFALIRVLSNRQYVLQVAPPSKALGRPHSGKLLYEKRGFVDFDTIARSIALFLK